jgi:hypothetical protein
METVQTFKQSKMVDYVIKKSFENWQTIGLVIADNPIQLNESILKPLFNKLDELGVEYVFNKKPPDEWGTQRKKIGFYNNILSIRSSQHNCTHILTNTIQEWKSLRGVSVGWIVSSVEANRLNSLTDAKMSLRCRFSHSLSTRFFKPE